MRLTYAGIFGVVFAIALAATLAVLPTTKAVLVASPPEGASVAIKQERETVTKTIRTIPISPVPPPTIAAPLVLPTAPVVQEVVAPPPPHDFPVTEPHHRADICAAHHCVKITSGRSWHCKCGQR